MTILTTDSSDIFVQFDTKGNQTYFAFPWILLPGDSVAVFLKNRRLAEDEFTLSRKGISIKPAPVGTVLIIRTMDIVQPTDFIVFDSFDGKKTEDAMDRLILYKQQAWRLRSRFNISADHYQSFVKIANNKGTDADIQLWTGANDEPSDMDVPVTPRPPTDPDNPPPDSFITDGWTNPVYHLNWQLDPNPPFNGGTIEIAVRPNGQITSFHDNDLPPPDEYPLDWNNAAPNVPNPGDFEARITWLNGWRYLYYYLNGKWEIVAVAGASRRDSSPWQNLATINRYRYYFLDKTGRTGYRWEKDCTCQLEIREVGRPETVKIKPLELTLRIQT